MRRLRGRTPLVAVAVMSALSAAGCGVSSATTTGLRGGPTGAPITVGISLPLTGDFAADGLASEKGYRLWASDLNSRNGLLGRPVKLIIRNDNSDEAKTTSDYRVLIKQDHVDLVLAPFSSLLTKDATKVTNQYGYALAAGSASAPSVYQPNVHTFFSTNVPVAKQLVPFVNWVASLPPGKRPTKAAYPMVDDPFADPMVNYAKTLLQNKYQIKTVYSVKNPYTKVSPAALRADADAVIARNPDMVVLGSVDVPTVTAFIREFMAKHFNPKIFIAAAGPDQGQSFIDKVSPAAAVGVMVPNGWYGGLPNAYSHVMVQNYIAKYGGTVSAINADVAEAYSAGEVLAAGVTGTHSVNNKAIISYLHSHTVQTVVGRVKFSSTGEDQYAANSALIFQWQEGGHFLRVLPSGPGTGSKPIIFPKPPWP